jgi:hypothetical protein
MTEPTFLGRRDMRASAARHHRMRSRGGDSGQTMPLVLGIILVLSLGTVVLVQNTFQQFPIVAKDVVQHEAYRAMQSGLDEYQYAVNANADVAACSARFVNAAGTSVGTSSLTASSTVCSALTFGSWVSVPGSGAANGPPAWFLIDDPVINVSTGNLSVNIIGAAGYKNGYNYQSALVNLQPLNGFLLNVLWLNYDQIDPNVVSQYGGGTCAAPYQYYWTPNPNGLQPNCQSLDFITADALTGNLFVNDTIFVCGSPSFLNVETADPSENWYEDGGGCSGAPLGDTQLTSALVSGHSGYTSLSVQALGQAAALNDTFTIGVGSTTQTVTLSAAAAKGATTVQVSSFTANAAYASGTPVNDNATGTWTSGVPIEQVPSDNSSLQADAASNGCVYQGPTTITLNGSANTMTVNSPGTPSGKPTGAPGSSVSNDPLNAAANTTNVCVPSSWPGTVAVPANGVVYVEGCLSSYVTTSGSPSVTKCNGQAYNPLSAAGETGTGGDTTGDAIVQGSVNSPMTIGSANNIVIDGNICYTDNVVSGKCTTVPAAPSTDVLGLVADNYVEINHPVDNNGNNLSSCSSTLGAGAVNCDLSSPTIDAVILALTHSFLVNNYTSGSALGTLNMFGTIDENWRGPVGTFNGGGVASGYAKNYQYDPRLVYLSPPYYLNPGTSQWGFASFTVDAGVCQLATGSPWSGGSGPCTGYP